MKKILNTTLFGAALMVAAAGFAQSSTSPQKGDEDRTPTSPTSSSTRSSTDTNSTGSASGSTDASTTASPSGTAGNTDTSATGTTGTYGTNGAAYGTAGPAYGSSAAASRNFSGTVKTIDSGRTLVITMANGRTQTFDISGSPTMDSSVAVGSRVRVKQTLDASGHKVVTVEPYR
jgi:hypothetical protein